MAESGSRLTSVLTSVFALSLLAGQPFVIALWVASAFDAPNVSKVLVWCMLACWAPAAVVMAGVMFYLVGLWLLLPLLPLVFVWEALGSPFAGHARRLHDRYIRWSSR